MKIVLDACAVIALVKNEQGADIVEEYLLNDDDECMIHGVNICEIYYGFFRSDGEAFAQEIVYKLQEAGVIIDDDMTMDFWQQVARYKATITRISLADCFALALASRESAFLVTSDRKEFEPVVPLDICQIKFIR
jgi:predicted nucleic acid-binding protein